MDEDILEKLADLEHVQWCEWAGTLSKELSGLLEIIDKLDCESLDEEDKSFVAHVRDRLERWDKLMVPYSELSEESKEQDRVYARKSLEIVDAKRP